MFLNCKLAGLLTFAQLGVLKSLTDVYARRGALVYALPRDLGAYRSSHHTHTLTRLVALGYAEKSELSKSVAGRPKYGYRVTTSGIQVWQEFQSLVDLRPSQVLGGVRDQERVAFARRLLT